MAGKRGDGAVSIVAYSDSDWAGEPGRKSVSVSVVLVDGIPVAWLSKKQTLVALSSSEAELIALVECVKRVRYVEQLARAFGLRVSKPVTVYGDNQASLLIAKKGVISRTKHLDFRKFYVKDLLDSGELKLEYVSTEENLADLMTKPLGRQPLERLMSRPC